MRLEIYKLKLKNDFFYLLFVNIRSRILKHFQNRIKPMLHDPILVILIPGVSVRISSHDLLDR